LLDGLEGDDREARLTLLERLAADGVSHEELAAAVAEDRLALLPLERVIGGLYTAAEVERRTGVPADLLIRFHRLLGLPQPGPDDRVFSEDAVAAGRSTELFLASGLGAEAVAEITRVLGEGMARLAGATAAAFADAFLRPGDTEADVALRFEALAEQLTPAVGPVLVAAYTAHLREAVSRAIIGRAEREAGTTATAQELGVCFADLVGFTRLGGEIEVQELGSVARQLARLAAEVTESPVRLVKTIGDAVMWVCPEPAPLVDVALSLVEAVREADMPSLRAGVAFGPVSQRSGDVFGHTVNVASRVTGVARPESVLCTQNVHDAAAEAFDWSFAGRFRLRGVSEPAPLHRARRPNADGASSEDRPTKPAGGRRRRRESS
jgi:adenylate cyclase